MGAERLTAIRGGRILDWASRRAEPADILLPGAQSMRSETPGLAVPSDAVTVSAEDRLLSPFLKRRPVGRHRLLKPRRPALPLPEPRERGAEIVLRHRPLKRHALGFELIARAAKAMRVIARGRSPREHHICRQTRRSK
jgi:hypothetical protein